VDCCVGCIDGKINTDQLAVSANVLLLCWCGP
jgi:hypothetical protein